jgi:hypothetical protein
MSEAWHAEQLAAIAPAPELVNQHEASAACGDMHCYWHHVDEPAAGAYKACGECGHVYRTAGELREAWVDTAADGHAPEVPTSDGAPPAEEIFACPLCAHDW